MGHVKVVALILAAGEGQRLGGPKALAVLHGETFFAHVVHLLSAASIEEAVAVIGAEETRVSAEIARFPAVCCVHNGEWRRGMLGSILAGLDAAEAVGADAVLVHPVDHPMVRPDTIREVVAALTEGFPIVIPSHGGHRGHPAGFARSTWPDLRSADPSKGARSVLAQRASIVHHVPVGPDCLWGINTAEDLARFNSSNP